jgi:tryptophan synthase beta chain
VQLVGVEAGGKGLPTGKHASRLALGTNASLGIAHGYKTKFLQDAEGQMLETHSVSAGLDYMGVSPVLAYLHDTGRVRFEAAMDDEVVETVKLLMKTEGIIPALESTHALVVGLREAATMKPTETVLINLSGRGDKDIFTVAEAIGDPKWDAFLASKVAAAQNKKDVKTKESHIGRVD